jgi:hypothetical protein
VKNTGAAPGENCALCGNQMNTGAIICGHCGAIRKTNTGLRGCTSILFLYGAFFYGAMSIIFTLLGSWEFGLNLLFFALTSLLLWFVLSRGGEKRVMYVKRLP